MASSINKYLFPYIYIRQAATRLRGFNKILDKPDLPIYNYRLNTTRLKSRKPFWTTGVNLTVKGSNSGWNGTELRFTIIILFKTPPKGWMSLTCLVDHGSRWPGLEPNNVDVNNWNTDGVSQTVRSADAP